MDIQYVAEPKHVKEVSLLGTAELGFWAPRLREQDLIPRERDGRAQILVMSAEMSWMGIRFSEISFSVLAVVPERPSQDAALLLQAFNSSRLFALSERLFFSTPYSRAACHVSASPPRIQLSARDRVLFEAEMRQMAPTALREPIRTGEEGWQGAIFIRQKPGISAPDSGVYYGKTSGHARVYSFLRYADRININATAETQGLQMLTDSGFRGEEWAVRTDATHGRSKTFRRRQLFG